MRAIPALTMLMAAVALTPREKAVAQAGTRVIMGAVVDSASNKPVSGAVIFLDRTATEQRSAKDGGFRVEASVNEVLLVIRRPGYVPVLAAVPAGGVGSVTDLGVTEVHQVKNDADRAAVQAVDLRQYPQLASFYERKVKVREGAFLAPDDLLRAAGTLPDIIRQKQGFRNICVATRRGELDCGRKSERGPSTIMGSGRPGNEEQQLCHIRVWTDDVGPERTLDEIRVDELLAVEAYPSPGSTPAELPGSPCATIRLWMKQARVGPGALSPRS